MSRKVISEYPEVVAALGVDYLKECFRYNPETGEITWADRPDYHFKSDTLKSRFRSRCTGKPVSSKLRWGRLRVNLRINSVSYSILQTCIAWLLAEGDIPDGHEVEPLDGDAYNLKRTNLSLAKSHKNKKGERGRYEYKQSIETLGLDYLRECFEVNFETGKVTWKTRPRSHFNSSRSYNSHLSRFAGRELVVPKYKQGRVVAKVSVGGRLYCIPAHYLVWYMAGRTVSSGKVLDHINRDYRDNRLSNLRECTPAENSHNCSVSKNNKTGVSGVYPLRDRWQAKISLGTFDTFEEAVAARRKAELDIYGAYAPDATTDPAFLSRTAGTLAGLI